MQTVQQANLQAIATLNQLSVNKIQHLFVFRIVHCNVKTRAEEGEDDLCFSSSSRHHVLQ